MSERKGPRYFKDDKEITEAEFRKLAETLGRDPLTQAQIMGTYIIPDGESFKADGCIMRFWVNKHTKSGGEGISPKGFDMRMLYRAWTQKCKLPSNKQLVYLKRCEGGLCTPDEFKQIRFCDSIHRREFAFVVRCGNWTITELRDLRDTFVALMTRRFDDCHTTCTGWIEI